MLINEYIEKAEKKAGTQKELARILGITTSYIRNVKAGKSGLPVEVCILIADYIEEDRLEVIAASNLVTEKDERKRKILESCFRKVAGVAAAAVVTSILTFSNASPTHAGFSGQSVDNTNYKQLLSSQLQEEMGFSVTVDR